MRIHELHAPVKVVQRSKGRSATAAAAYRSGSRIEDERTGQVHDYTRKRGIEADALLLPDNAPEWAHDRGKLWNAAELNEKHPRAQTAREVTVSFPSEFSAEQRQEAGMKIGQWIMFRYGSAVDLAWHEPSKDGDQRNHHAHFLFTARRFDENGQWARTKDRTLDDLKKGPEEIAAMRLGIADALNNIAARDKLDVYVEHLSYEKRGLDQEPTQHMGPIATEMERDGMATDIGNKNREIAARNEERRKLQNEQKVIDIELARESLKVKQQQERQRQAAEAQAARADQADAYEVFYRDAQARRAGLLEALDRQHAEREKNLRQEIAGIANSLDSAGFFTRVWRNVTGRTRQDKERMANAARTLEEIQRQRQAAHESFERDRLSKLEALKAAQRREREALAEELPRAVGDRPAPAATRPPQQQTEARAGAQEQPGGDYDARRRAYFQRLGAKRKAEREQSPALPGSVKAPIKAFREAMKPAAPEPGKDFEQAKGGGSEPAPPGKAVDPSASSGSDYASRRAAYLRRIRRQREHSRDRDDGPSRDR